MRKRSGGNSHRSKYGRRLITAIEAAGGTVITTARGHLMVRGPAGTALLSSKPTGRGRSKNNLHADLRRHAGIDVTTN